MNTLFKQTLTASILSTMIAGTAFAAPSEAPPDFIKRVADGLISRLKADHAKLQNNPALVKTIVRQNLDPYVDSQAFTRIVDTVYDSKFTNMKELRVQHRGKPLRAFFAFDPLRQAIVLCIGDKGGKKRFYKEMLDIADQQYELHLSTLGDQSNG